MKSCDKRKPLFLQHYNPMATKRVRDNDLPSTSKVTRPFSLWSRSLARPRDKLKPLYLDSYSVCDQQSYQGGNSPDSLIMWSCCFIR